MELVRLGRTDAAVSRLGCGGAPAGLRNYLAPYDPAGPAAVEVVAAVQRALELGVTYFDTAPGYGDGASERLFGEGLRGAGEHVFVASKCGAGGPLRDSVSRSLERLGRDRLDLLQLHGSSWRAEEVDRILGDGGVADQLAALRTEGLVRYLGFTSEDQNPGFWRLLQSGRFDVVQLCYNVLLQHPYDPSRPFGSLYQAAELGLGTVAMRSLTSGLFTRWLRAVRPADDFDWTPALLQFVLSCPLVNVALVGLRTPAEVERNVAIATDLAGRVDLAALYTRYVSNPEDPGNPGT